MVDYWLSHSKYKAAEQNRHRFEGITFGFTFHIMNVKVRSSLGIIARRSLGLDDTTLRGRCSWKFLSVLPIPLFS